MSNKVRYSYCHLDENYIIEVLDIRIQESRCEVVLRKKPKGKKDLDGVKMIRRGSFINNKFRTSVDNIEFIINLKTGKIEKVRGKTDMDIHLLLPDLIGNYCKTKDGWGIIPVRIDAESSGDRCVVELNLVSDDGDVRVTTFRGKHINYNFIFEVHNTKIKINVKTGSMHKIRDALEYDL